MSQRRLHVAHVLVTRGKGEDRQVLVYPHRKWSVPDSGRPLVTVPGKKIDADPFSPTVPNLALRHALAGVLREDLGLSVARPAWESRLPRAAVEMCSPAQRVPTTYSIWPVEVRIDAEQHDAVRARLGGEWLSEREALRRPYLSPTARRVLGRDEPAPADPMAGGPRLLAADDWSLRLVAARAGNADVFGSLFKDMTPWLRAQLAGCDCTRALRRDEIDDALQDAVLNALRHLQRFDPYRGSAATWMRTLAHHAGVTILRRRGRAVVNLYREGGEVADRAGDPAELSQQGEQRALDRRRLELALVKCGPLVRRAWELRYVVGLSYAEIAGEMRQPIGTIATWIHRVKKVARELANGEEGFSL